MQVEHIRIVALSTRFRPMNNIVAIWEMEELVCSINVMVGNKRGGIDERFSMLWRR